MFWVTVHKKTFLYGIQWRQNHTCAYLKRARPVCSPVGRPKDFRSFIRIQAFTRGRSFHLNGEIRYNNFSPRRESVRLRWDSVEENKSLFIHGAVTLLFKCKLMMFDDMHWDTPIERHEARWSLPLSQKGGTQFMRAVHQIIYEGSKGQTIVRLQTIYLVCREKIAKFTLLGENKEIYLKINLVWHQRIASVTICGKRKFAQVMRVYELYDAISRDGFHYLC